MQQLTIEEKQFCSRLEDLVDRVEKRYQEEVTDFLTPALQRVAKEFLQERRIHNYFFTGGYSEAERKRLVLYPEYNEADEEAADIVLIRLEGNFKFVQVNHRDFLGALMSLGIKREKFGDLLADNQGCYLFAAKEVVPYIQQNCPRVKHVPVEAQIINHNEWEPPKQEVKELHIMVSSLRIDTILAHGFGFSRTKAIEMIQSGRVQVNYLEVKDNDFICREQDLISCRGKGKLKVVQFDGETKKGKEKVILWKYI